MDSKSIVMRRIYYSYALSILISNALWQGVLLGACIAAFGRLTHVSAITNNILATPTGLLPEYIASAFIGAATSGELLTVLTVLLMLGLSIRWLQKVSKVFIQPRFA
jgi:Na+/H+-dicarboxylate symporter